MKEIYGSLSSRCQRFVPASAFGYSPHYPDSKTILDGGRWVCRRVYGAVRWLFEAMLSRPPGHEHIEEARNRAICFRSYI